MANRSYLYNIDFNRVDRNKTKSDLVYGVSEYAYQIPISYKILVSENSQNSPSMLWDYEHPIAIIGETTNARERLFDFLEEVQSKNLFESEYLEKEIEKTKAFFSENKFELKYFFLESGEIYEMGDSPFETQNSEIFKEVIFLEESKMEFFENVQKINQEIKALNAKRNEMTPKSLFSKPKPKLNDQEKEQVDRQINNKKMEKRALLGIDNWSTILYYHYDNSKIEGVEN